MAKYSRRELKRMLRTKTAPHNAPPWIFKELEKMRKQMNREAKTPAEILDDFMKNEMGLKKPRPWISGKQLRLVAALKSRLNRRAPAWAIKVKEFLLDILWDY